MKRKQYFKFLPINQSERLYYELLSERNSIYLYKMFQNDSNLSVDERFKEKAKVDKYVSFITQEMKFLAKNAGCDWLIYDKRNNICSI